MESEVTYLQHVYREGGERYFQDHVKYALRTAQGLRVMNTPFGGNRLVGRLLFRARWSLAAAVVSLNENYRVKRLRECVYVLERSIYQEPGTAREARCLKLKAGMIYDIIERAYRGDLEAQQSLQQLDEIYLDDRIAYTAITEDVQPDYGDASDFRPKERVYAEDLPDKRSVATMDWYFDPSTKKRRKVVHGAARDDMRDPCFEAQFEHAGSQVSEAVQSISSMLIEIATCVKSE